MQKDQTASKKPGFNWVTPILCVSDLVKSLAYYQNALGFEVSWQWSEEEAFDENSSPSFACVCRGEVSIFLCEQGQGKPGAWMSLFLGSLDELEQMFIEYRESSAIIVMEPQDCPWGMREMEVEDPDGNTFRIGSALSNG